MTLVKLASSLEICRKCRNHGHIEIPGKTRSLEFVSKADAIFWEKALFENNKIDDEERLFLLRQIADCSLPEEDEDASPQAWDVMNCINNYFTEIVRLRRHDNIPRLPVIDVQGGQKWIM